MGWYGSGMGLMFGDPWEPLAGAVGADRAATGPTGSAQQPPGTRDEPPSPEQILDLRFARGEIDQQTKAA